MQSSSQWPSAPHFRQGVSGAILRFSGLNIGGLANPGPIEGRGVEDGRGGPKGEEPKAGLEKLGCIGGRMNPFPLPIPFGRGANDGKDFPLERPFLD